MAVPRNDWEVVFSAPWKIIAITLSHQQLDWHFYRQIIPDQVGTLKSVTNKKNKAAGMKNYCSAD